MNSRAVSQMCILQHTAKGVQLLAEPFISPKMLTLMFSLHFLKIFRQGYYVYSSVKRFDYSALMTAVVMVVQVMLTLK